MVVLLPLLPQHRPYVVGCIVMPDKPNKCEKKWMSSLAATRLPLRYERTRHVRLERLRRDQDCLGIRPSILEQSEPTVFVLVWKKQSGVLYGAE
jgi:hypothetical protein